jgi:hypothetical protein
MKSARSQDMPESRAKKRRGLYLWRLLRQLPWLAFRYKL